MNPDRMLIATICTRGYLPRARVLAESFVQHVPDGQVVALVVDAGHNVLQQEPFTVLRPLDVVSADEFARMATAYDLVELCTAIKPTLLAHLLDTAESVHYLDPDIRFHGDPRFLDGLARTHGIVLTPHLTTPPRDRPDGAPGGEDAVLPAGVFNLGYIGVSRRADPAFLPWWRTRLARDCLNQPEAARFVDQRWIDLVPGYFPHAVVRHPGVNLGWWNMPDRQLQRQDGRWTVDGEPLVFHHASGYQPDAPHAPSRYHAGVHSHDPAAIDLLYDLVDDYRGALMAAGQEHARDADAGLGLIDHLDITRHDRRRYREALVASERAGSDEPPNPFRDGVVAFADWLEGIAPGQSRIRRPGDGPRRPGVNVVGYFRSPTGVGMAARHMTTALEQAGVPHATYTVDDPDAQVGHPWRDTGATLHDVTLVCANAEGALHVNALLDPDMRAGHRIGLWWWETEDFPASYDPAFTVVDEVWTGSEFSRRSIAARTHKPVRALPLPITVTHALPDGMRSQVGADDDTFLVVSVLSLDSVFDRKNPLGAISAYREAFGPADGARLVMKINAAHRHAADVLRMRYAARGRDDIHLVTEQWPIAEVHALIAACDCMLSLHRSEGFGITLAEAMAYGRPVVATDYGGNTDFMDEATAFPVPFTLAPIGKDAAPYEAEGEWAEPDTTAAAELLRTVRSNPRAAAARAEAGRRRIERDYSPEAVGRWVAAVLPVHEPVLPTSGRRRSPWWRTSRRAQTTPRPMHSRVHASDPMAFYHSITLPDGRTLAGDWTIDDLDQYMGNVALKGRRVLDAGTATGLLAFTAEQRGAREVVALDLPLHADSDAIIPVDDARRAAVRARRAAVRHGFWECHAALGSSVQLRACDLRDLPDDLGRFDVAILGNVLQHLRDPAGALVALADLCNVLVVTEADWHHERYPDDLAGMVLFDPGPAYSWFQVRPAFVTGLLGRWGFGNSMVTHHVQRYHAGPDPGADRVPPGIPVPHVTTVCWRDDVEARHVHARGRRA